MNHLGKFSSWLSVLLAAATFLGCTVTPHKALLTETEVLAIASRTALAARVDLSQFKSPEAYFEYVYKDRTWVVFYVGLNPAPGNHFMVQVNDSTRNAAFVGGY